MALLGGSFLLYYYLSMPDDVTALDDEDSVLLIQPIPGGAMLNYSISF